ncbi:MAG TPA: hypothetical protein VEV16_11680 [Daejeonella sp.]|nr:hypothetical protein [Daejeonella sp.]
MSWIKNKHFHYYAFGAFVILSLFGVALRYMQLFPLPGANYAFLLHAHSHFAFSGWMFFALALLLVSTISGEKYSVPFRRVFILTLLSALGMLVSFSFQGYKALSIGWSTLFILLTYRFSYLLWKSNRLQGTGNPVSVKMLWGALLFLCLSSVGPFALGPLMASGHRNSPLYQNAIYFYLHFQMNGWMLLAALSLLANKYLKDVKKGTYVQIWLNLFVFSILPLYFIFTLWKNPAPIIWMIALAAALIHLISWLALCFYFRGLYPRFSFLVKAALLAVTIKSILQVLICIPAIGAWAMLFRDTAIAYVHLVVLGCVTPLILDRFEMQNYLKRGKFLDLIHRGFIFGVVLYLSLLFICPLLALFSITIPAYHYLLFALAVFFLLAACLYLERSRFPSSLS